MNETGKHDCSWLYLLGQFVSKKLEIAIFVSSIIVLLMAVCVFLDRTLNNTTSIQSPNKLKYTNITTHTPGSPLPMLIQTIINVCLCHSSQKSVSAHLDVNTENNASEYLNFKTLLMCVWKAKMHRKALF